MSGPTTNSTTSCAPQAAVPACGRRRLEPPDEVDRIVLRQAREAIEIDRPQPCIPGRAWGAPLAIAATLLVVFTVVLHVLGCRRNRFPEVTVQQVTQRDARPPPAAPALRRGAGSRARQ